MVVEGDFQRRDPAPAEAANGWLPALAVPFAIALAMALLALLPAGPLAG